MEFAWDEETGRICVIELNPRMASQLAVFYEWVDGISPYRMLLELACGEAPGHQRAAPQFRHAASFALRKFDGKPLANEMKWLGSYRYAVVNLAAGSSADLYRRCHDLRRRLFADSDLSA